MQGFRVLLVALATLCLSGCFTSDTPLLGPDDLVFPFETVTYREPGSPIETTMVHEGNAYVIRSGDHSVLAEVRLKDLGDNLYLAQMTAEDRAERTSTLYGVIRLNRGEMSAATYGAIGRTSQIREGLRECGNGILCIDDLDVYVSLAKSMIAANEEPDAVYEIIHAR